MKYYAKDWKVAGMWLSGFFSDNMGADSRKERGEPGASTQESCVCAEVLALRIGKPVYRLRALYRHARVENTEADRGYAVIRGRRRRGQL